MIDRLEIPGRWPEVRAELEQLDTADAVGAAAGARRRRRRRIEPANRRRIVRALEVTIGSGRPFSTFGPGLQAYPPTAVALIGLRWPRAVLAERIERARRGDDGRRPARRGARPGGASGCRAPLARRSATRSCSPTSPATSSLDDGRRRDRAAHPPVRRPPGAVVPSRPARTLDRHRSRSGRRGGAGGDRCVAGMTALTLTKHHGLGNDFLVLFAADGDAPDLPAPGRGGCATAREASVPTASSSPRTPTGADARMVLYNADGSRAEMSGNGIRCLAQAARRPATATWRALRIATDAGIRTVELAADRGPGDDPRRRRHGRGRRASPRPPGWASDRRQPGSPRRPPRRRQPAHRRRRRRRRRRRPARARRRGSPTSTSRSSSPGPSATRSRCASTSAAPASPRRAAPAPPPPRGPPPHWGLVDRRRRGTGRAHGRRQRDSCAPPPGPGARHAHRAGHLRRHDRGPLYA